MKSTTLALLLDVVAYHSVASFRSKLQLFSKVPLKSPLYDADNGIDVTIEPKELSVSAEIARLNAMAAKLRAEAAELEVS